MILVDPLCDINYSSFYIYGLWKLLGKKNVKFSTKPFTEIYKLGIGWAGLFFYDTVTQKRYIIDYRDSNDIVEKAYEWCDIYGCVNVCANKQDDFHKTKLVVLGPNFGIRLWRKPLGYFYAINNAIIGKPSNLRKFFGKYRRMLKRMPLESYITNSSDIQYIFHISTLWYSDHGVQNDKGCNLARAQFIRACKNIPNLTFKGGLVPPSSQKYPSHPELFSDVLTKAVCMEEWLRETQKSFLVFNTPAWDNCNGWKLGEYLAMGKAIISTELSNDLPVPLIHGENIHFVENDVERMKDAVDYISSHPAYRMKLEKGARQYWDTYGAPEKSLNLLGLSPA